MGLLLLLGVLRFVPCQSCCSSSVVMPGLCRCLHVTHRCLPSRHKIHPDNAPSGQNRQQFITRIPARTACYTMHATSLVLGGLLRSLRRACETAVERGTAVSRTPSTNHVHPPSTTQPELPPPRGKKRRTSCQTQTSIGRFAPTYRPHGEQVQNRIRSREQRQGLKQDRATIRLDGGPGRQARARQRRGSGG